MQFRMTWPTSRVFPDLGEVESDAVIDADENPDPAFFEPVRPTPQAAPFAALAASEGA